MKNRLKLDWSLNTAIDRKNFIDKYICSLHDPTPDELETIANYLLYGKDEDGQSSVEKKEIEIETRSKTWTKTPHESLNELMESPTFNESQLRRPEENFYHARAETFSRTDTLAQCPPSMRQTFENLFAQIDELELSINFYELRHGKRKKPPRDELSVKFTEERQSYLNERVSHWNQYIYLKNRHLLVELRREQYLLRDSFVNTILRETPPELQIPVNLPSFEEEIPVFPFGVLDEHALSASIFRQKPLLNPSSYTEEELKEVSNFLWKKKSSTPKFFFDFRDPMHVFNLIDQFTDLDAFGIDAKSINSSNTSALLKTFQYYRDFAELSEIQEEILDFKIKKTKNKDISSFINKKYGKSYTDNYISTIFRQKIIPKICAAAVFHQKIIENLFFEEEFKQCNTCGQWFLIDGEIFVRKAYSKDGHANRCKKCDKLKRQKKKEMNV